MSRVLIAWELGSNLGHVAALLLVARALRSQGHAVVFALRELTHAGMIAKQGFSFLPGPMPQRTQRPKSYPSYAAMLAGEAFPSANAALVCTLAWRSIMDAVRPDLLIVDHAPVALLAVRGRKIRTATIGSPFTIPSPDRPLPLFLKGHAGAPAEEATLLARLNAVLEALRAPRLLAVSDLYRTDTTMVRSVPDLDCFGPRPPASYVAAQAADVGDATPAWPEAEGARALVYLKPGPWVEPVLAGLAMQRSSVIAYILDLGGKRGKALERPGVVVSDRLYKASVMIPQADLVLCHGSHGTVAASLLAGKPLVMMPNYIEQVLTAGRVVAIGAGVMPVGKPDPETIAKACNAVRPDTPIYRSAGEIGRRYVDRNAVSAEDQIMGKLDGLLERAAA